MGFHIAHKLALEKKEVVVIDKDEAALARVNEALDVQTIQGSGSNPSILERAGIREAQIFLAVTDSDETNIIACIFANLLMPQIQKIVRLRNDDYHAYREALARDILNINLITNPDVEVVNAILRLMTMPQIEEVSAFANGRISLIKKQLPPGSLLDGLRLRQLPELLKDLHIVIGALTRQDQLIIPTGEDRLQAGDTIYFVCAKEELSKIAAVLGSRSHIVRNILIVGGGKIGLKLAQALDGMPYNTKIIEKDINRGKILSAQLRRSVILQGDGTDPELLSMENISSMDMVIAVTGDEELNILSCLLAKRLGAKKTVARINKFAYMSLVEAIGIDHIVSTRMSAVNSILHYIRRGKIIATVSIAGEQAEAIEAIAEEYSAIVGTPLKKQKFPPGVIILSILRDQEVIIPKGDSVIQPQDRLIIMATRKNIPLIERSLMVKMAERPGLGKLWPAEAEGEIP